MKIKDIRKVLYMDDYRKLNTISFDSRSMLIEEDQLEEKFARDLKDLGRGRVDPEDVKAFIKRYKITGDDDVVKDVLEDYGTWEDEELEDDEYNLIRLVWIMGSDLEERGEFGFG